MSPHPQTKTASTMGQMKVEVPKKEYPCTFAEEKALIYHTGSTLN